MIDDALTSIIRASVAAELAPVLTELADVRAELAALRETARQGGDPSSDGAQRRLYWRVDELAEALRVSPKTVRRWIDAGRIHHVRLPGGAIRIPASVFADLEARGITTPSALEAAQ